MGFSMLKQYIESGTHAFKNKEKVKYYLSELSLEDTAKLAHFLSRESDYLMKTSHLYVIDYLLYNMSDVQKQTFIDNIFFNGNENDYIVLSKIRDKKLLDKFLTDKEWLFKSNAIYCINDKPLIISIITELDININHMSYKGETLIHNLLTKPFDTELALNFMFNNKEKIDFQAEYKGIALIDNVFDLLRTPGNRGKYFAEKCALLKHMVDNHITMKESSVYKYCSLHDMILFIDSGLLVLNQTGTETEGFKSIFTDICVQNNFLRPQQISYFEPCFNKLVEYKKIKKTEEDKKILQETVVTENNSLKAKRI